MKNASHYSFFHQLRAVYACSFLCPFTGYRSQVLAATFFKRASETSSRFAPPLAALTILLSHVDYLLCLCNMNYIYVFHISVFLLMISLNFQLAKYLYKSF